MDKAVISKVRLVFQTMKTKVVSKKCPPKQFYNHLFTQLERLFLIFRYFSRIFFRKKLILKLAKKLKNFPLFMTKISFIFINKKIKKKKYFHRV